MFDRWRGATRRLQILRNFHAHEMAAPPPEIPQPVIASPGYTQIAGYDPQILQNVPLERRKETADLFKFDLTNTANEDEPMDREAMLAERMAPADVTDEFINGYMLGFGFSWVRGKKKRYTRTFSHFSC